MYIYKEAQLETATLNVPGTKNSIEISFEKVTPEMADNWLATNVDKQRKLNKSTVRQYVSQMKKGIWSADTGEAIKFSKQGLIDGQHRLHAVIEYGSPVILMIMRNINDELIAKMDVGKKRSLADIFKVRGMEPPKGITESMLASIINGLYVSKEFMSKARKDTNSERIDSAIKAKPSPVELYEFALANPSIFERLNKLQDFKLYLIAKSAPLGPTIVGWFLCDVIDPNVAYQILKTIEECSPVSGNGRSCAAFKMYQHVQRARSKKITINKFSYPGLWLWAFDHMKREAIPNRLMVQSAHLPGQGHEGSTKLKKYFRTLEDIS